MSTIKDVAKLAGVSATTVSIVINGKAKERSISEDTCNQIYSAMESLGYRPNMYARKLRGSGNARPVIVLYWPSNYLIHVMATVLNALLTRTEEKNFACQLVIEAYDPLCPEEVLSSINRGDYEGAFIGCAPQEVIDYFDNVKVNIPIVFINRISRAHSFVAADVEKMMMVTAQAISAKGHRKIGIFTTDSFASTRRLEYFIAACKKLNIETPKEYIFFRHSSIGNGAKMAEEFLSISDHPSIIFSNSDALAIGALNTCYLKGIKVPDELEILAIELMDSQFSEHTTPPLTTIAMPTHNMCDKAADYIIDCITNQSSYVMQNSCEAELNIRKSFTM